MDLVQKQYFLGETRNKKMDSILPVACTWSLDSPLDPSPFMFLKDIVLIIKSFHTYGSKCNLSNMTCDSHMHFFNRRNKQALYQLGINHKNPHLVFTNYCNLV